MQNSMSGGFYAYGKTKSVIACVTIADFFYIIINHPKMFIVAHEKADGLSILEVVPDLHLNLPAKETSLEYGILGTHRIRLG